MFKKLLSLFILLPTLALASTFTEGKDYQLITDAEQASTKNKMPLLVEFFSYGCPWCYRIETPLNEWVNTLGKNVTFERVPVVFKPEWEIYAKAYYTAKILALTNKMNPALFKAIQDDKKPLNTTQTMVDFFIAQGLDKEIANSAFKSSPTIEMRLNDGMHLMAQYQINAIPAFVINNKYKTDLQMAGSPEHLIQILDYLIRQPA